MPRSLKEWRLAQKKWRRDQSRARRREWRRRSRLSSTDVALAVLNQMKDGMSREK